jgi:hypothetical protein
MSLRMSGIEYDFLAERDWKERNYGIGLASVQALAIQI